MAPWGQHSPLAAAIMTLNGDLSISQWLQWHQFLVRMLLFDVFHRAPTGWSHAPLSRPRHLARPVFKSAAHLCNQSGKTTACCQAKNCSARCHFFSIRPQGMSPKVMARLLRQIGLPGRNRCRSCHNSGFPSGPRADVSFVSPPRVICFFFPLPFGLLSLISPDDLLTGAEFQKSGRHKERKSAPGACERISKTGAISIIVISTLQWPR
jgi:hypothetical protein